MLRMTRKQVEEMAAEHMVPIYQTGYCALEELRQSDRFCCVSSRELGWACDVHLFKGFIVTTGYRPFGENIPVDELRGMIARSEEISLR